MRRRRVSYPGKPALEPLPQFRGTALVRQTPEQRAALIEFVAREYQAGKSLRELAALSDRSQTAIRRALAQAGLSPRQPGAPQVRSK
ncbi:MAG: helix-turn-helix domain-containing protein [Nocardioides sp.]